MKDFWNSRYKEETFAYGTKPNAFFKENIDKLSIGTILLPAEGEVRNAVYAVRKGWDVMAFDFSEEAKNKTLKLAQQHEVSLNYDIMNVADFSTENIQFDVIGLFFCPFPCSITPRFSSKSNTGCQNFGLCYL